MRLLVTGFEPFGGETINPSWEVAQRLPNLLDAEVHAALLPVHAQRVRAALDEAIARARPDLLLSLGQAGRRFEVTPERIAINLVAYRDEAGEPREEPIEPDGPAAYFTTLDLKRMVAAMREAGVPAQISNSAGAYICNEVAYLAQHRNARTLRPIPAGFIHLPYLPQQVVNKPGVPSMALETMLAGVAAALRAIVAEPAVASA